MEATRDQGGKVDIPDGMDHADARVAIKLLYGADQTYRSALRDFANYERCATLASDDLVDDAIGLNAGEIEGNNTRALVSKRKRLRRSGSKRRNGNDDSRGGNKRRGRITHLHVTGITSMFLPSWDLSFVDIAKLDRLRCLKLNGCDSVPAEIFFELPHLKTLCLINCQELTDPVTCIASHRRSKDTNSTIERLDIRGGGLWGPEFLSALRVLLPWMSTTLVSLRLTHTPYASCYDNKYTMESFYGEGTAEVNDDGMSDHLRQQRIEEKLLEQTRFHETMGRLLLDALLSLARGTSNDENGGSGGNNLSILPSPLEDLGLSFFDSLLDRDVASLLLDVIPEFPHLTTLRLPHHTIANLKMAAVRITDQQTEYVSKPDHSPVLSPRIARSSWVSRSIGSLVPTQPSIASVSRLRRLWLKPTLKHRSDYNAYDEIGNNNSNNNNNNNQIEEDILVPLLSYFPELASVARSANHKGYLYSPCPSCWSSRDDGDTLTERKSLHLTIEYLLRMNHTGRCLLEGLDSEDVSKTNGNRRRDTRRSCPLSVWPLVLERAWKVSPPDFCVSGPRTSNASAIFHLLREGPILSNQMIPGKPNHCTRRTAHLLCLNSDV